MPSKSSPILPANRAAHPQDGLGEAVTVSGLVHAIANRLTASGTATYAHFGLGLLDARILYALETALPASAGRLAARLAVDPAAVSRALGRLGGRDLVVRDQGGLRLTPRGLALAHDVKAAFEERCLRMVEGVSVQEVRAAQAVLQRIHANLGHVAALGDEVRGGDSQGQGAV